MRIRITERTSQNRKTTHRDRIFILAATTITSRRTTTTRITPVAIIATTTTTLISRQLLRLPETMMPTPCTVPMR